ncbi:Zn-ribbon domain-containing OB-fold protein [Streptomyces rapamycinicus]|uniref:Zn-ribbon domain-containing OB-fold protein n=1 Tax=Streptomyces rapamycinicus TaxID=1226757 RepID=UPI000EF82FE8|nr:OB-fold domain-containing protein [Streptomyces rapamycinicus]UTP35840.1 OB-fold domain-containing protein [Streptomyces rapamycinicus NRRL 5491]
MEDRVSARVAPVASPLTAPYWEGIRARRLRIQRCASCRRYVHFPRPECPSCGGAELSYEEVSGRGLVHTFSVVHRTFAPGFADRTPYVIAWIELVEQPDLRAFGNVLGCEPGELRIGMPVELCFEELDGFGPLPAFRPFTDDSGHDNTLR